MLAGRVEEGRRLFEAMLKRANDVGLYAEEIGLATDQFLGNFPQGFTHIARIRSALFPGADDQHHLRGDPEAASRPRVRTGNA